MARARCRPAATSRRQGIPEATVARLPVYLRALGALADEGVVHRLLRGARRRRRRQLGQAAQGPLLPRLLRHPRRRLRRRVPRLPDRPASSASPRTGRSSSSASATSGTRSPTTAASPPAASRSRALVDADPAHRRRARSAGSSSSRSTTSSERRRARGVAIGGHRHPGRRRPGGLRPAGRRRRRAASSTSRPTRAVRARRRRRAQGRPVDRAADPRLPRAAQGVARSRPRGRRRPTLGGGRADERPRRRPVPPHRAGRACSSGSPSGRDAVAKLLEDVAVQRPRRRGGGALDLQPGRGLRRRRQVPRRRWRSCPSCWRARPASPLDELTPHLYVHYEDRAVAHLFSVACGLDSMVVGESQILGQVRAAPAHRAGPRHRRRACWTSWSSRPCGSASGPTPRPASTGPGGRWSPPAWSRRPRVARAPSTGLPCSSSAPGR